MTGSWVPHDTRDLVVDFVKYWSRQSELPFINFIIWLAISSSKFYYWQKRYGKANEHNGLIPRDFWLEDWEKKAVIEFHRQYPQRWHGTLKQECIRPGVLLNLEDARQVVGRYVEHYNEVSLNSAIGYVAPADKLNGKDKQIFKERDRRLESARQARKIRASRSQGRSLPVPSPFRRRLLRRAI